MATLRDPAVLFFIDKWLLSTAEMDSDVRGWYLNLILHQFDKKSLPNNIEQLATLAGVKFKEYDLFIEGFNNVLIHKFEINENGRLVNQVADTIIKGREAFKEKRTRSGNVGVIIKMAKKFTGFGKIEKAIKEELDGYDLEQIEALKDIDALTVLINTLKEPTEGKKAFDLSFIDAVMLPIYTKWLVHKKDRRENYSTQASIQNNYNKLIKDSKNDPVLAELIIDFSVGNNYAGFFPLKGQQMPAKPKPAAPAGGKGFGLVDQFNRIQFNDDEQ